MEKFIKLNAVYYDKDMEPKFYEMTVNVDNIARIEPSSNGKNWQHQACVTLNDKTYIYVRESYKKIVGLIGTRTNAVKDMITVTVVKIKRKTTDPYKFAIRLKDIVGVREDDGGAVIVFEHGFITCKESYGKVMRMIREAQRA